MFMIEIHKLWNLQQTNDVYTWIREKQTNQPQQEIQRKSFGTSKINEQSQYWFKESKNSWTGSLSPFRLVPQTFKCTFSEHPSTATSFTTQTCSCSPSLVSDKPAFRTHGLVLSFTPTEKAELSHLYDSNVFLSISLTDRNSVPNDMLKYNKYLPGFPSVKLQVIFFLVSFVIA